MYVWCDAFQISGLARSGASQSLHGELREAEQVRLAKQRAHQFFADISGVTTKVEQGGTFSGAPPSSI